MSALGQEFKRRSSVLVNSIRSMGENKDGTPNKRVLYSTVIILALAICGMVLAGCAGSSAAPKATKHAVVHHQKFHGADVALNKGPAYDSDEKDQYFYHTKDPGQLAESWSHFEFSYGFESGEYKQERPKWMTTRVPGGYSALLRARGLAGRDVDSDLMQSRSTDVWIDAEIAKNDPSAQPWVSKLYGANNMHLVRVMTEVDLRDPLGADDDVRHTAQVDLEAIVSCPAKTGCRIVRSTYAVINDGLEPVPADRRTALFSQSLPEWKSTGSHG